MFLLLLNTQRSRFLIEKYRTIAKNGQTELIIKKSRFIASVARVEDETAAQDFLTATKKKYPKANHHCFAYQLGFDSEAQRMSDDGEPSGTAGSPILEVLEKQNLVNVICVVTRYFGGIKLGAGGLIRAYGSATAAGIEAVGKVAGISQDQYELTINYNRLDLLTHWLTEHNIVTTDINYTDQVCLKIWLDHDHAIKTLAAITDLLADQLTSQKINSGFNEVPIQ